MPPSFQFLFPPRSTTILLHDYPFSFFTLHNLSHSFEEFSGVSVITYFFQLPLLFPTICFFTIFSIFSCPLPRQQACAVISTKPLLHSLQIFFPEQYLLNLRQISTGSKYQFSLSSKRVRNTHCSFLLQSSSNIQWFSSQFYFFHILP